MMPLTDPQKLIVKNYVEADVVLNALPHTADGAYAIAKALMLTADPAFIVWKTSVSIDEIMRNGMDWARVDNLSVGKARIWDWMGRLGTFDPSKANIRTGIDSAWVGTAGDLAVRAVVYTHCKRSASVLEKLLATGTGTDVTPATMGYEGAVNYNEIISAMGW
jgi:hypothetical protein